MRTGFLVVDFRATAGFLAAATVVVFLADLDAEPAVVTAFFGGCVAADFCFALLLLPAF